MNTTKRLFAAMMLLITTCLVALAANIKGIVVDKQTGEALIGATVMVGEQGCATDSLTAEPLKIEMESDQQVLGEVKVTGMARKNTDVAMIEAAKLSDQVVSNISAQEIRRTQDNNAGEVIRRVPGVSLIEDKFVMVRGLSQRYNNVWINGGAVPSSEADSRAFSFETHNIFISH